MAGKLLLHCCRMSRNQRAPQLMHQLRGSKAQGQAGSHQPNKQVHVKPDLGSQDWPGKQVLQVPKRLEKLHLPAANCGVMSWSQSCTASFIKMPARRGGVLVCNQFPAKDASISLLGSLPLSSMPALTCAQGSFQLGRRFTLVISCVTSSLHQTYFWQWGAHTA